MPDQPGLRALERVGGRQRRSLAVVRDVAETHGGTTFARPRPGGGAMVGFSVSATRLVPAQ
jgi:hypothetical protein